MSLKTKLIIVIDIYNNIKFQCWYKETCLIYKINRIYSVIQYTLIMKME